MRGAVHLGSIGLNVKEVASLPLDGEEDDVVIFGGAFWRHDGVEWAQMSGDTSAVQANLDAHLADTSDAHDASAISFAPTGDVAATDVQAAIAELDSEKEDAGAAATVQSNLNAHTGDTSDAHDASAISVTPAGGLSSTDVQAALEELDAAIGAGGVSDGDKGDITVSGGGAVWTIDSKAVDFANIQDVAAGVILGSEGGGDIEELSTGTGLQVVTGLLIVGSPYAAILEQTPTSITAADSAIESRMHHITGTSADYDITLPVAPASGTVVGFMVDSYAAASKQYRLDAGGTVKIAGRTRYLTLLHTNVALLRYDGAAWQPLVLCLDTPWVKITTYLVSGTTLNGTTTDPTLGGGTTYNTCYWRRVGHTLEVRLEYRQTTAGTAGSGTYLFSVPIGTIDTTLVTADTGASVANVAATFGVGGGTLDRANNWSSVYVGVYDSTSVRAFATEAPGIMSNAAFSFSNAVLRFHFRYAVPMTDW